MEWWPFLIFHRGGLRIKVINNNRSSGAPAGRNEWFRGELCSGTPIAEPLPRWLVSANFDIASRIRACGSVRIFGHDGLIGPFFQANCPANEKTLYA